MPGRFREGTETCIRKVRTLETLPTCRQTQNPAPPKVCPCRSAPH
ncbi:hypothetical protein P484_02922, partial [Mycobacterium tuberculosis TKK_04_0001]